MIYYAVLTEKIVLLMDLSNKVIWNFEVVQYDDSLAYI